MHALGMRPQPPQRTLLRQPESIIGAFCDRTYCPSKAPLLLRTDNADPDARLFLTLFCEAQTHTAHYQRKQAQADRSTSNPAGILVEAVCK